MPDDRTRLFVMNADGTGEVQLTANFTDGSCPRWSVDGQTIIFSSLRNPHPWNIHTMNADGSNVKMLIGGKGTDWYPDWLVPH
ncbi:MAG: hypothetical protein FJX74_05660 [Armatimonadetes bacterium]|nr:hypothetical protein [Armatimonadota bacterium]